MTAMPRAQLIKRRVRAQLKPRLTTAVAYHEQPGYIPLAFGYALGDRVRAYIDGRYLRTGTVKSRVPCEPEPLYYVELSADRVELLPESQISGRV